MKLFKRMKDGGTESKVSGFFVAEIKSLFSIVLLHFAPGSREAYHSHAFKAVSWVLRGKLIEQELRGHSINQDVLLHEHTPSFSPIKTPRTMFHKVLSVGDTWVLSFRGPWAKTWREFLPLSNKFLTLTHGRKVVE